MRALENIPLKKASANMQRKNITTIKHFQVLNVTNLMSIH